MAKERDAKEISKERNENEQAEKLIEKKLVLIDLPQKRWK
jgi:hypothetical protein